MANIIIGIYKITNPKGKIYIGRSINIFKRWSEHKYESKSLIYRSINKYGFENHKFEIIEQLNTLDNDKLNELEIYYIQKYDSTNVKIGLNLCKGGGRLGFKHSAHTIEKMKRNRKGKKNSLGRIVSQETKNKIAESLKGNKLSQSQIDKSILTRLSRGMTTIVLDVNTGIYYYSVREASKLNCINRNSLINRIKSNKGNLISV